MLENMKRLLWFSPNPRSRPTSPCDPWCSAAQRQPSARFQTPAQHSAPATPSPSQKNNGTDWFKWKKDSATIWTNAPTKAAIISHFPTSIVETIAFPVRLCWSWVALLASSVSLRWQYSTKSRTESSAASHESYTHKTRLTHHIKLLNNL